MKIWLHFREMLKPFVRKVRNRTTGEEFANMQDIVDVEIAQPDTAKMYMVRNMDELVSKINKLKQNMHTGGYTGAEIFQKQELLERMHELHHNMKQRYQMILDDEIEADKKPQIL